jgi:protein-disulfide isomerase
MRASHADLLLRLAAAVGLAVSALLLLDYTRPVSGLCGDGGGCDVVKASAWARPLGVPVPLLGVAYFAALALAAAAPRLRRVVRPLALTGALGALGFLALQAFVIGTFCRFCLVADGAALVAGACALAPAPAARGWRLSAALSGLALAVPAVALLHAPAAPVPPPAPQVAAAPALPEVIAREQRPGVLTIVSFTDFECPFCRKLHVALEQALEGLEGRVRVVRKMVPLEGLHSHALDAAMAWCCAARLGRGDAMADRLYAARDLSRPGCERLARDLGLDAAAFGACLADPATRAQVARDTDDAEAAGVAGRLPTYWIGSTMYRGAADAATLRARIDAALAGQPG